MTVSVQITHKQGDFTLDVAFDAPEGLTVLFGRSGSGKTSVINAIAGLLHPDAGRIAIGGHILQDSATGLWLPPHKRRIGYVFQDARLFPHLSVRQNLTYGQRFSATKAAIDPVVEMLGLGDLLNRRPAALSGGEKQRVAIGRALLSGPELILADEPLAALDEARKDDILPYFERLRDEVGIPIVYVSHAAGEVARLATTVVVMDQGRVRQMGPAGEVLSDPSVTPVGVREAGAMIEARVGAHSDDGLSDLLIGDLVVTIPNCSRQIGDLVRLRIAAQDVMIATQAPQGISALNVLPATIKSIRMGDGPGAMVQMEVGGATLLSRITRRSVQTLGLTAGQKVFAVLKAVSVAR